MPNILLATHGTLGSSLKETAEMIIGSIDGVECFEMSADLSHSDAHRALTGLVTRGRSGPGRFTVLVDIQGGSPFNICTEQLIEHGDFTLLTGANLPLLLEAATNPGADGSALATAGAGAVVHINAILQAEAPGADPLDSQETESTDD